jgi:hypothetical protein
MNPYGGPPDDATDTTPGVLSDPPDKLGESARFLSAVFPRGRAVERGLLYLLLAGSLALQLQVRGLQNDLAAQECYSRTIGLTVLVDWPSRDHPHADAMARGMLRSCRSPEKQNVMNSDDWGKR